MAQKSAILHFSPTIVDKPVINTLVKKFEVNVNILQARITPEEDGTMFLVIEGSTGTIEEALNFLRKQGVQIILPNKNVILFEERCTHCGACVGQCLPKALSVEPKTRKVVYDERKCIACELCIPACPFAALESVTEHIGKKEVAKNG